MSLEKMTNFLGLWSPVCGSSQVLWTGSTLEAAALEWQRLVAQQPDEKVDLTAYGRGEVASHRELEWRYGTPKASFACPICGKETPHEHTGEAIAWYRDLEAWKQRDMEKRWERIEARIAELTALNAAAGVPAPAESPECFPLLDPLIPEMGSRYPEKGCYRPGCQRHGGPGGFPAGVKGGADV